VSWRTFLGELRLASQRCYRRQRRLSRRSGVRTTRSIRSAAKADQIPPISAETNAFPRLAAIRP